MRPEPPPRRRRCHRICAPGWTPRDRTPRGTRARSPWWEDPARRCSLLTLERPYLNRQGGRLGELTTPFERGVEIGRLDDTDPADMLFPFGERPVGHEQV